MNLYHYDIHVAKEQIPTSNDVREIFQVAGYIVKRMRPHELDLVVDRIDFGSPENLSLSLFVSDGSEQRELLLSKEIFIKCYAFIEEYLNKTVNDASQLTLSKI